MKKTTFKTNINCTSCIYTVTPVLNESKEIKNWSVDISVPEKTLTVEYDEISPDEIIDRLKKVGYIATPIS